MGLVFEEEAFLEKPDKKTAPLFIEENTRLASTNSSLKYFWNSGMFCFKAKIFLEELKNYEPQIYEGCLKAFEKMEAKKENLFIIHKEDMELIPEKSVDYALMERSNKVIMIKSDFHWSDLGSFESFYEHIPKDELGNTLEPNVFHIDSKNNLIISNENRIVTTIGVENLILVDTTDALLVAKKGSGQRVREIVQRLKEIKPEILYSHRKTYRPWGSFEVLLEGTGYKI